MKIIIAGGRDFDDSHKMYTSFMAVLNEYAKDKTDITIFSGHCSTGADILGELLADCFDFRIKLFPANWDKYGKSAGPIRNEQMAKGADRAIIFWDRKSKGTKNMIAMCEKHKVPFTIIEY